MKVVSLASLTANEKKLVSTAVEEQLSARAGYSHFKVGAAVGMIIRDNIIIGDGCNVENVIYEVGHAEHGAVHRLAMMIQPNVKMRIDVVAVALLADKKNQHAVPCGLCRQWLREFGTDKMTIYGVKLDGSGAIWQVERFTLGELLKYSFGPNNLNR